MNRQFSAFILIVAIATTMVACKGKVRETAVEDKGKKETGEALKEPLQSWNEGKSKQAIIDFVSNATNEQSKGFIPVEDRIAVFDNDGTLWSEHPIYFQFMFVLDQVHAMAPQHPEWQKEEPFRSVLAGDIKKVMETGEEGIEKLMMATHVGNTVDQFEQTVKQWIDTARHPIKKMRYIDMVYQPMIELIDYLQQAGFKTYIVSGGGVEFMRAWAGPVYKIPKEQTIGSAIKTRFEMRGDTPVLARLAEVDFIDDGPGKPVGINRNIGKRPVAAFGNSDGDLQMLQWTAANTGNSLVMIVHHTDSIREFSYDRHTPVGKLDKALDEANKKGWHLIDMKDEWKTVYKSTTP